MTDQKIVMIVGPCDKIPAHYVTDDLYIEFFIEKKEYVPTLSILNLHKKRCYVTFEWSLRWLFSWSSSEEIWEHSDVPENIEVFQLSCGRQTYELRSFQNKKQNEPVRVDIHINNLKLCYETIEDLLAACRIGDVVTVERILTFPKINITISNGQVIFDAVIEGGFLNVLKVLVQKANLGEEVSKEHMITIACKEGLLEFVKYFYENWPKTFGWAPKDSFYRMNRTEILEYLLSCPEYDPNPTNCITTPLAAACNSHFRTAGMVRLLLSNSRTELDCFSRLPGKPLDLIMHTEDEEIVGLIVQDWRLNIDPNTNLRQLMSGRSDSFHENTEKKVKHIYSKYQYLVRQRIHVIKKCLFTYDVSLPTAFYKGFRPKIW